MSLILEKASKMYSTDRHLRFIGKLNIYFLVLLERSLHLVAVYANNMELSFYSLTQIPEEKVYVRFWLHEATQNSTPPTHKKRRKKEKKNKHKNCWNTKKNWNLSAVVVVTVNIYFFGKKQLANFNRTWLNIIRWRLLL